MPREIAPPLLAALPAAFEGNAGAIRTLLDAFTPVIQARVTRALARRGAHQGRRDPRQEVEDLTQEVLVSLFEDGARKLRAWDPARGMSLLNFVGLLAEHVVADIMASGRRNPWKDVPLVDPEIEKRLDATEGPELAVLSRDLLRRLVDRLRTDLTPRGLELFHALVIEERPTDEVAAAHGMRIEAIHTWRSRFAKLARGIAHELITGEAQSPLSASPVAAGLDASTPGNR